MVQLHWQVEAASLPNLATNVVSGFCRRMGGRNIWDCVPLPPATPDATATWATRPFPYPNSGPSSGDSMAPPWLPLGGAWSGGGDNGSGGPEMQWPAAGAK